MDLEFSDELMRLRQDVRRFVAEKAPRMSRKAGVHSHEVPLYRQWMADRFEAGYLRASWASESGGWPDRDPLEDSVVDKELPLTDAPEAIAPAIDDLAAGAAAG